MPATRLGPYEIIGAIGAGGMGEVYRARDVRIGRDVAIKILPVEASADPERLRRFEQESRSAGSLSHPNLVTIHDVGTDNGTPYIVMELLEGETLRDRIGQIPQRKAIEYATQLAVGLAAAHEKGIIHRDLKPENIFITADGRVKILDFGLAKLHARPAGEKTETHGLTKPQGTSPGTVMGTVGYMSPEQVRGEDLDHRADIFALGAILYEMLTGQRAFHGKTAADTMSAILREDPPEFASSPSLAQIVRHCLEKNPAERFQSARDLAFDLQMIGSVSSPSGPATVRRSLRTPAWRAAAVILLALVAYGAYRIGKRSTPQPVSAATGLRVTQLTFRDGVENFASIAPDGKTFIFTSRMAGNDDIYLQRIDGQNAINLTAGSAADDTHGAFSSDGSQIVFRSDRDGGGIFVMGATGESVRRISDFGFHPSWSPDSKEIVCTTEQVKFPQSRGTNSELWIVEVATGKRRLLTREERGVQPVWSPHGNRIAFWGVDENAAQRDLYTIDARTAGAKPKAIFKDAALDWNPVWSPDGKYIFFGSDRGGTMNLWRIAIDELSGEKQGDPEPLPVPSRSAGHFTIAQGGRLLFSALEMASAIRRAPLTDTLEGASTVLGGSMLVFSFDVSPDKQFVAFTNAGLQEDVYIAKSDGSDVRQLTNDAARDRGPSWTPDGKQLLFYSNRGGRYDIWRINADGSGLTQVTAHVGETLWFPRMSPDGKQIIATSFVDSVIFPAGKAIVRSAEIFPLPPDPRYRFAPASWSADSRRIAGLLNDRVTREAIGGVAVYDLATKKFNVVRATGEGVRWLPDGKTLLILEGRKLVAVDDTGREVRSYPFPYQTLALARAASRFGTDGQDVFWVEQFDQADIWMVDLPR